MNTPNRNGEILKSIQGSNGVAAYGEMLVEVQRLVATLAERHPGLGNDISTIDDARLQAEFVGASGDVAAILGSTKSATAKLVRILADENREAGVLPLAGDVLNLLYYVQTLQRVKSARLKTAAECQTLLTGPIGTSDRLGKAVDKSLPVSAAAFTRVPNGEVGVYAIETVTTGQGNIPHYDRKEGAARDFLKDASVTDAIVEEAKRHGIFYTSLIALGITRKFSDFSNLLWKVRSAGATVAFDTNYRGFVMQECFPEQNGFYTPTQAFEQVLPFIDVLFAGREDLRKLYPRSSNSGDPYTEAAAFFRDLANAPGIVIMKAAEDGVFWRDENGEMQHLKPQPGIHSVDTTGAGDSHNAAVLLGLRDGKSVREAVMNANRIAGCVIQRHGANLAETDLEELLKAAQA